MVVSFNMLLANDVVIENLEIIGDNSTNAGIAIQPPSERVEVRECTIHGMGLANPGNDSPLAYGILAYGSDSNFRPDDLVFTGNEIYDTYSEEMLVLIMEEDVICTIKEDE